MIRLIFVGAFWWSSLLEFEQSTYKHANDTAALFISKNIS